MENLLYNISQILGITVIHSLWQGLLVYLLVRLIFIGFPSASSDKKYHILYIALLSLTIWFAYTFLTEAKNYNWTANAIPQPTYNLHDDINPSINSQPVNQLSTESLFLNYKNIIQTYLPYISGLYAICILINLARLAIAWQTIRKIKKEATTAGTLQQRVNDLATRIGIGKSIKLNFSQLVDVPCAIGYIKPILLLPVTITTQLSADEIEVILIHELAHIKNNDYLLNLIQQIVMLLLFLNPFAQMISSMINRERENRCDDAVLLIGNPLTYAGALIKLEKTRQKPLQLALAATGKKYHLFARIQRIMDTQKPVVNIKHLVFGTLIFIGSLGSLAWLNPQIKNGKLTSARGEKAIIQLAAAVKKVIAPVPITNLQNKPELNAGVVGETTPATQDTIKPANSRDLLVSEYKRWSDALVKDHYDLDHLPEMQQYLVAQKILDSVRTNKLQAALTPELKQEIKDGEDLWNQYFNSPEILKKKAQQQRLLNALQTAYSQQPELIAYEKDEAIKRDSVRKKIMQLHGLTEYQLSKNEEYIQWLRLSSSEKSALVMKLNNRPEIKLLQGSEDSVRNAIYSGPEFDALNKRTRASKALQDVSTPAGLEKYKADFIAAKEKLYNTAEWKKYQQDAKRHDDLVKKLKQTR